MPDYLRETVVKRTADKVNYLSTVGHVDQPHISVQFILNMRNSGVRACEETSIARPIARHLEVILWQ
jgi:hypothetical protein